MPRKSVKLEPICSMRTDIHTDRHTDIMKLTVAFRNYSNELKNHVPINTCDFTPGNATIWGEGENSLSNRQGRSRDKTHPIHAMKTQKWGGDLPLPFP